MNVSPVSLILGRRVIVVDRSFQLRYSLQLALVGGAISALCGGLLFALLRLRERALGMPPEISALLSAQDGAVAGMIVAVAALMAVLLGVAGVLVTHRIAGPVYALTRYLTTLAEGRYPRFRPLRKDDELRELLEVLQAAVEQLRAREVQEAFRLHEAVVAFEPLATTPEAKAAVALLRELHEHKRSVAERGEPSSPAAGAEVGAAATSAASGIH